MICGPYPQEAPKIYFISDRRANSQTVKGKGGCGEGSSAGYCRAGAVLGAHWDKSMLPRQLVLDSAPPSGADPHCPACLPANLASSACHGGVVVAQLLLPTFIVSQLPPSLLAGLPLPKTELVLGATPLRAKQSISK